MPEKHEIMIVVKEHKAPGTDGVKIKCIVDHEVERSKEDIIGAFNVLYGGLTDAVYELWFKESSNMDPEVSLAS